MLFYETNLICNFRYDFELLDNQVARILALAALSEHNHILFYWKNSIKLKYMQEIKILLTILVDFCNSPNNSMVQECASWKP